MILNVKTAATYLPLRDQMRASVTVRKDETMFELDRWTQDYTWPEWHKAVCPAANTHHAYFCASNPRRAGLLGRRLLDEEVS